MNRGHSLAYLYGMRAYPNFVRHLFLQKRLMLWSTAILLAQAGLIVVTPLPLKAIIDGVLSHKPSGVVLFLSQTLTPESVLLVLVGVTGVLALATAALDYLEEYVLNAASSRVMESMRKELVELLLTRTLGTIERRRKIDFLGRLSGDVTNFDVIIISGLSVIVRALPTLVLILVSMFLTDWRFSAVLAVALPVMYLLGYYFSARLKVEQRLLRYETNDFEQDATQSLESVQLIKSLSIEEASTGALNLRIEGIRKFIMLSRRSQGGLVGSLTIARNAVRMAVLVIGGYGILRGSFSLGTLVVFLTYTESMSKPINELAKFASKYAKALTSIERVEELYRSFAGQQERGGLRVRVPARVHYTFSNVTFGYENGPSLLNGFSAQFSPGRVVGLIGPSGTGKSSFLKLINRLADPQQGEILLGGVNLRDYELKFLRRQVSVVYQETFFIHASVRENLTLVRPERPFTQEEIWSALRAVNAEDFVRELPSGLDTVIGEGARRLSGGQAQRLGLARAFLRAPGLLYVFDEATSGLDPISARIVFESAQNLAKQGACVFWVTHRMEELQHCHELMYFQFGENPVCSSHAEMLRANVGYRNFYSESGLT